MKKREQYSYFYVDAFTYHTMHDETLKEMNRVKDKEDDKQRTIVQVSIPVKEFKLLKKYGFKVTSIDWGQDKDYKDVILDSYDFIVSSPSKASLSNYCEKVIIDTRLEETISKYIENSPKTKIRVEIPPSKQNTVSVYLSLPTLLAYKLKFSSLMSGVYMVHNNTLTENLNKVFNERIGNELFPIRKEPTKNSEQDKFNVSDSMYRFDCLFMAMNNYSAYKEYMNSVVSNDDILMDEMREKFVTMR